MTAIQTIYLTEKELDDREARLTEMIKHLEQMRIDLHYQLLDVQSWKCPYQTQPEHLSTLIYEYQNGVLKLVMDGMLPFIYEKQDSKYYRKVRDYYIQQFVQFVKNESITLHFEPAFVFLAHYFPDLRLRDLDNRNKGFIFNGLRHSGIIGDDNWRKLAYMEAGFLDAMHPRVEIFVTDASNMGKLIEIYMSKWAEESSLI
ncbi:hypothetical protein [Brevibacillus dissolubilis]|uniref:hypothetical protein n=1 Tax=Brevibacillus dissolubilis TaxID=1844116 RepID=UPI0011169805|nr:hypothetical protein [Brevibacillus dissolubilis]